jgi:hypothetical protein
MPAAGTIGPARLARLLVWARLRSFRNGLRGRARTPVVVTVAALVIALAYVGLFAQSFSVVVATVGPREQSAALAVVVGLLALASWSAKAASSEALRAGSPENEFLLSRPVGLGALVAGRGIADAVTDPIGALFLFPVLFAASLVWRLPPAAWGLAAVISAVVQLGISMTAYAAQVAIVRLVPAVRRRAVWVAMRLFSALALAGLWAIGTGVLRAPAALATQLAGPARWLPFTPGGLIAGPLAAWASGAPAQAAAALGRLALAALAAVGAALAVARTSGLGGWEEAGASWAEAAAGPARTGTITAANKDLRLIVRDRTQLLVLIAMPAIFVGIQVFAAAGWSWSTSTLARVSCLSYSLALYMATIGPLAHMQAERRAFWILRTVPVPLGRLLAAKARAWAILVGAVAAITFAALVALMPAAPWPQIVGAGLLVAGGAAAMSFLAVAMASGGADLSDDQSPAVGPVTIYAFLLVGGLYNLVLTGDAVTRAAGLVLYLFTLVAYWRDGVERASICFDAEAIRAPRLRAADGATLALVLALGGRGVARGAAAAGGDARAVAVVAALGVGLRLLLALVGARLLRRAGPRPKVRAAAWGAALALGAGAGALTVLLVTSPAGLSVGRPASGSWPLPVWLGAGFSAAAEEVIWRGVLQGAVERALDGRVRHARWAAALASVGVGIASLALAGAISAPAVMAQAVAAAARAGTGALSGALAGRLAMLATRLAWGVFP